MTAIDIDAIRAREQAATDGPWLATDPLNPDSEWFDGRGYPMVVTADSHASIHCVIAQEICNGPDDGVADSEFIAHARQDIPALLAENDRLRAELRDKRNDLLDVRGILSPNGCPRRVPMELVPTVAPAVEWLVVEVDRLRAELSSFVDSEDARLAIAENEVGRLKGEVDRLGLELFAARPVVEAAEAWAQAIEDVPLRLDRGAEDALYQAVEQQRLMALAIDAIDRDAARPTDITQGEVRPAGVGAPAGPPLPRRTPGASMRNQDSTGEDLS